MKKVLYNLRHIILFGLLIGSDFLIGYIGYQAGSEGASFGVVIAISVVVILIVEYLFKGGGGA